MTEANHTVYQIGLLCIVMAISGLTYVMWGIWDEIKKYNQRIDREEARKAENRRNWNVIDPPYAPKIAQEKYHVE